MGRITGAVNNMRSIPNNIMSNLLVMVIVRRMVVRVILIVRVIRRVNVTVIGMLILKFTISDKQIMIVIV